MNYLTLLEVADLLADILDFEDITAGCIDGALDKTVGVYQRAEFVPRECVGTASSYETAKMRLVIRWGNNPTIAEKKASEFGLIIRELREAVCSKHIIIFADVKAVRSIGKDDKGICEYVIDADFTYKERNE